MEENFDNNFISHFNSDGSGQINVHWWLIVIFMLPSPGIITGLPDCLYWECNRDHFVTTIMFDSATYSMSHIIESMLFLKKLVFQT